MVGKASFHRQGGFAIPPGSQQEIHRGAGLINRTTEIFPGAPAPHTGFVHSSAAVYQPPELAECRLHERNVFEHPAVELGMLNSHALLLHHLLKLTGDATHQRTPQRMTSLEIDRHPLAQKSSTMSVQVNAPAKILRQNLKSGVSFSFSMLRRTKCRNVNTRRRDR